MKRILEKYRKKSRMKTYNELLGEVRDFTVENLGKNFVIKGGCFEGETDPMQSYWYVDIEDLEEC